MLPDPRKSAMDLKSSRSRVASKSIQIRDGEMAALRGDHASRGDRDTVGEIKRRSRSSAFLVASGRFVTAMLSLAGMIIIARDLGPQEFAPFAFAVTVLAIVELLTEQGFDAALAQKQGDVDHFLDTVWTVNMTRGFGLTISCMVLGVVMKGVGCSDGRAEMLMAIGAVPGIKGLESLAKVTLTRGLAFRGVVANEVCASILGFVSSVAAYTTTSIGVWSLAVGAIVSNVASTLGSYVVLPRRPVVRFCREDYRELRRFGLWVAIAKYASAAITKGPGLVVAVLLPASALSIYQLADKLATTATMEVSRIINRVALPMYSRSLEHGGLGFLYSQYEGSVSKVGAASYAVFMVMLISSESVVLLLAGQKWLAVSGHLPWISLWGASRASGVCVTSLLFSLGRPRAASLYTVLMFVLFAISAGPVVLSYGTVGICVLLSIIGLVVQPWRLHSIARILQVGFIRLLFVHQLPLMVALAVGYGGNVIVSSLNLMPLSVVGFGVVVLCLAVYFGALVAAYALLRRVPVGGLRTGSSGSFVA